MIAWRLVGLVVALSLLAGPGGAPAAGQVRGAAPGKARPIAVLGLRPATDRTLGQTAITLLPEAQRLRTVAESVIEILTGAAAMGHEELRAAVGRSYLVDLFDCRDDVTCQLRVAAPLARQGVKIAIVGDYWADGATLRFRIRRLDLAAQRVVDEATFAAERGAAETLAPWQEALRPLFQDTGRLRIVANVAGSDCTLDARPCDRWPAETLEVEEGEHVLELSKEGYRRASRVIMVKRGEELRVAIALEELPVQLQRAPDPSSRLPTFAAAAAETQIVPFGSIRLAVIYDDVNEGDREDVRAPPEGTQREGTLVFLPRPAVIGVGMQVPRSSGGWELRCGFGLALVRGDLPEFDSAFTELVRPDSGLRVMIGWGAPLASGLTAGTLTLPEGFGDLNPGMVGVTVSRSFGPIVLEGLVGKHKGMFNASPEVRAATPLPFLSARVAYVDEEIKGSLYGADYPLTASISGVYGWERVGLAGEQAWAGSAFTPLLEDLPVWLASAELFVPFGRRASLAGEGWYGQSVHRFEGALWQVPRVDPATGRHRALRSAGGWAQLALPVGRFELRVLAGLDRAVDGLSFGLAPGDADAIRENRLAAINGVCYPLKHLALGAQLHVIQTIYEDPAGGEPSAVGVAFSSRLTF